MNVKIIKAEKDKIVMVKKLIKLGVHGQYAICLPQSLRGCVDLNTNYVITIKKEMK